MKAKTENLASMERINDIVHEISYGIRLKRVLKEANTK